MEEIQPRPMPAAHEVSFPQPKEPGNRGSNSKIIIAVIGVILIVVIGGWFILGNNSGDGLTTSSPTPGSGLSSFPSPATETSTPSPTPSPSPAAKGDVKIEVLNGTGVPGEASFLQDELEELGFKDIEVGNAEEQDEKETVATYSRELSPAIADEITEKLEELYQTVRTRRATVSGDFDVTITTGTRKSGSSPTASPKASASPTASPESEE